jgi:hypothetical protein
MYMMAATGRRRRWTVASARQGLPKLLALAAREPQAVYRRDKLVAAVVSPAIKQQIESAGIGGRGRSLAAALDELRGLCAEEGYVLEAPQRVNRGVGRKRR